MKAPSLACLALGSALSAQGINPQSFGDLRPTEAPIQQVHAVVDMETRDVSFSDTPIPVALGVTPNVFDNTLQPSVGVVAAVLQPGAGIVDWGTLQIGQNTLVEELTISYGADTPNPDLRIALFAGYEGFGAGPFGQDVQTGVDGPGDSQLVLEIELENLPGDDVTPGNGLVVPYELTITLDEPFSLDALSLSPAQGIEGATDVPVCFGWGYASEGGGVGPLLVDTQCVDSPFGPTSKGYEATTTADAFEQPDVKAMVLPIDAHDDFAGAFFPGPLFTIDGRAVQNFSVQGDGAITFGVPGFEVTCDGDDLQCNVDLGPPSESCYKVAPFWADYQDTFGPGPTVSLGTDSRVLLERKPDRIVVTWQNMRLEGNILSMGVPSEPQLLDFQAHLIYCSNRIEYRYAQAIVPPQSAGLGQSNDSFVGLLTNELLVSGGGGIGPGADLQIACDAAVTGETFAITRGELPVNNGVTNKLDFYQLVPPAPDVPAGTIGGTTFDFLGTGDFDTAGVGAIASTFLRLELIEPCEIAIFTSLGDHQQEQSLEHALFVSGPPIFGSMQQACVANNSADTFAYGVLATSPETPATPTPFGDLWVDLVMPGFLEMAPMMVQQDGSGAAQVAVFPVVIPVFDPVLCGQVYHLQGGMFGGATPALTNAYAVTIGVEGHLNPN